MRHSLTVFLSRAAQRLTPIPLLVCLLLPVLSYTASAQYCTAGVSYCDEYIGNVTVAGINNTTGCVGYTDYTTTVTPGAMTAGQTYPVSIYNPSPYTGDAAYIWIDWNNNQSFADAGEYFTTTTTNYSNFSGSILCPVGTITGAKRMRVRMSYGVVPGNPCGIETYGEVEDYTINVTGMGDPPPIISLVTSPACASTANQTVVATITDNGTIAANAIWFRKNLGLWYNAVATSVVGNTYTFTINHATLGGVVFGDLVQWYLGARDNNNGVTTLPSGGSGATPPGSTPPAVLYSYNISVPLPYYQSFDAVGHGWTFGGTASSWRVGTPGGNVGTTAASPPNALLMQTTSNVYNNNEQSWAMSPPMNFSTMVTDPVLAFSHKYDFEGSWDGGFVQYTTNGGSTWVTLGTAPPDPTAPLNWYNVASIYSWAGPCWNGSFYGSWQRAVHNLTGLAGQSCVQLRFRGSSDGSVIYSGWAIDDIAIGNFPQKDVEVLTVSVGYGLNRWAQVETLPHVVSTTIKTNGWEAPPTSVTLVYKEGSLPASALDGTAQTFTPTWAAGTATLVFSTPYTPATVGPKTLYVRAFYTGDANATNDSKDYVMTVQTDKVYGFEDFEGLTATGLPSSFRTGWTHLNSGGANTWGVFTDGPRYVGAYVSDLNANDHLISPPALLRAGSSYRVRFKYSGCSWGTAPTTLVLMYGKTPNPAQMSVVNTWIVPQVSNYVDATGVIPGTAPYFNTDPSAPANYYIAFQVTNPSGSGCVAIDDIVMDDNPSPPPKIGYGFPGQPVTTFVDDPAIPIVVTANYKQPGMIDKTFAVTTTTNIYGTLGDFLWDVQSTTPWITITKSTPDPTLQGYNFTPPRPRQLQTFTMTIDPSGLPVGVHLGKLTFYGILFNNDFPPPASGLIATNEPFNVTVQLRIIAAGSGAGAASMVQTRGPLVAVNSYPFADPTTGDPIATVHVTSGQIDQMTIRVFPNQLPQNLARMRYVKRYWQITHVGTAWTADITFPYAPAEASMVTDPLQLRGVRQSVNLGQWEDPIVGTTSTSNPSADLVRVFNFTSMNIGGNIALSHPYGIFVKSDGVAPAAFGLEQNYPNPFNPSTTIAFSVAEERPVRLMVYNQLGLEVAELISETLPAGSYTVTFDASDLATGPYLCRMIAGDYVKTIQMVLSK